MLLNDLGAEGWDFVRVESLPLRHGFWSFRAPVEERCLMIFRRECAEAETETAKKAPTKSAPAPTQPQMASRKEVPHFVRTARLAETPTLKAVGKGTGSG
ncbi:hypothetical protein EJA01_10400 [Rhodovulum iodosum]|uniref:hypothetical protein n=1 Tax=Rhodovulum iodosum TaxID=68291 RepID=UPI000F669436|nr:hypothetical protein [Rhodovulum robiginosum]RSK32741.1 hypothetical protein EJA01_10400 [Rhodovulum robiginosum]